MMEPKRGRPTILSEAIIREVCAALEEGAHFETACESASLSVNTAKEWLRRGERGDQPYEAFSTAVTCARARGELFLHRKVYNGGKGSHGAQFLLERRFREHYGDIKRIEHAGHDGGAMQINVKPIHEMTDDELIAAIQRLESTGSALPPGVTEAPSEDVAPELLCEDGLGVRPDPSPCEGDLRTP